MYINIISHNFQVNILAYKTDYSKFNSETIQ